MSSKCPLEAKAPEARQTRQNLDQTEDRKVLHREQGGQTLFHHFRAADPDEMHAEKHVRGKARQNNRCITTEFSLQALF